MTNFDYKLYMKNRQHKIEQKSKGKLVEIPERIKPVKSIWDWELSLNLMTI